MTYDMSALTHPDLAKYGDVVRDALKRLRKGPIRLISTQDGCVLSMDHKPNRQGYLRRTTVSNGTRIYDYAHRVVFSAMHGPEALNDGYEVNHLCQTRACLNPNHMERVTKTEHNRRTNAERRSLEDAAVHLYWLEHKCGPETLQHVFGVSRSTAFAKIKEWKSPDASQQETE